MSSSCSFRFHRVSRSVVLAIAVSGVAACSADVNRLADYPPVNQTASLPKQQDRNHVAAKPLDNAAVPRAQPSWQNARRVEPRPQPERRYAASSSLKVQPGQTLYSIARANGLTVQTLAAANNIHAPYNVMVGQRLKIPGRAQAVSPDPSFRPLAANAPAPSGTPNFSGGDTHKVRPGETLFAVGRAYSMSPFKIAAHNNLAKPYHLNAGQILRIPGGTGGSAKWDQPSDVAEAPAPKRYQQRVEAEPKPLPQPPAVKHQDPPKVKQVQYGSNNGTFRWPVVGRVISTFGSKPNGTRNEGINISVPEGASVRSAGSGVVAYAGNELKGYGNLVLIRHEGGWVSAYAHNSELFVRRGDTVKRGEVIAKAGSTGSVSSPQLHFELRRGASAVDPLKYLSRQSASN